MVARVWQLVLRQVLAGLDDQALGIHEPHPAQGFLAGHPLALHGRHAQIGDPDAGLARAEEQQCLLGDVLTGDAAGAQQAGQCHGGGALNVVVEGADPVAVLLEQSERVAGGEVLELDQRFREQLPRRGDELLHEIVVLAPAQPLLADADVELVLQQLLVVRSHVECDGERESRMHAGAGRVERELADRNAHPMRAQVAQAEDALTVGHHDDAHVLLRPVPHHPGDLALVLGRDVEATRLPEDVAELGACLTHRGRVDDRHHVVDVVDHRAVEQRLVAVLQRDHEDVLLEGRGLVLVVFQHPGLLLLDRVHDRRQQPAELVGVPLLLVERRPLVDPRVVQQGDTRGERRLGAALSGPLAGLGPLLELALGLGRGGRSRSRNALCSRARRLLGGLGRLLHPAARGLLHLLGGPLHLAGSRLL